MSAFVVSREHVAALVKYLAEVETREITQTDALKADVLLAANVLSVAHRYPHDIPEMEEPFTAAEIRKARTLPALHAISLAQSLQYQSCERDDYENSVAERWTRTLIDRAASRLPGWDAAPWTI